MQMEVEKNHTLDILRHTETYLTAFTLRFYPYDRYNNTKSLVYKRTVEFEFCF